MNKLTYEERVQDIARKMSMRNYGKWGPGLPTWVQSMDDASLAVAEMAEAYEWGHHDGWMSKAMNFNRLDSPSLREGKIKSGLIPDDGQEARSNGDL